MVVLPSLKRADVVNVNIIHTPLIVSILGGSARSVGYGSNQVLHSRYITLLLKK